MWKPMSIRRSIRICAFLAVGLSSGVGIYKKNFRLLPRIDADTDINNTAVPQHQKLNFRDKKVLEYENRIRSFSTPDKIFRYFATVCVVNEKCKDNDTLMTTDDFIRSISPGHKQPENYGLDKFNNMSYLEYSSESKRSKFLDESSILNKIYHKELISYSDYILLLLIVGTSQRIFKLSFKVFDVNSDNKLSYCEFQAITSLIRKKSAMYNVSRSGCNKSVGNKSPLNKYMFGNNLDKTLTLQDFLCVQEAIKSDIVTYEFNSSNPTNNVIKESKFAKLVLTYASLSESKKQEIVRRISETYKHSSKGISCQDYKKFCRLLQSINDMEIALTFYNLSDNAIDKATFKRVSKVVSGVDLEDYLVDVVFSIFDANEDGQLSPDEFIKVMKQRVFRGLNSHRDLGFIRALANLKNYIWAFIIS